MKLSIKQKIVLWYAIISLVILSLVISILFLAGDRTLEDEAKENLTIATDRAVRDVQIVDQKLVIDDDITYYMNNAYVVLCRDDGTVISGLLPDGFPGEQGFQADEIRQIGSGKTTFFVYDRKIENQQVGTFWVRGMTAASLDQMAPFMMRMIRIFLIALPLLFLLMILGGWAITKRGFAPLTEIADTVEQIQAGSDLSRRLDLGDADSPDEIRRTAGIFDQMLGRMEESFESEKRFTNDASHELRTPTAVILAQCEYALDNLENQEEVEQSLRSILSQSQKMSSLLQQLLMLARADRGMQRVEKTLLDIGLVAEEAAANMSAVARERGIAIAVDAPEALYVPGDGALLSRLFENLLSNGIKYGRERGHLWIRIESMEKRDPKKNGVQITVSDDGMGIEAGELSHIWDRFYRGRGAAADEKSMGLGLPLVKWIVEAHDGDITVHSERGSGTTFEIFLPMA